MNSIIISGRIVRDPEIRYAGSGETTTAIARFSVASNRKYKREGEPDADFFNCVAFGKNATFIEKYIQQGNLVIIRGWMKQDNYTNKDGQKVYQWNLNVDEIDFGQSKKENSNTDSSASAQKPKKAKEEPKTDSEGFMDIPDDLDVPFL